MPSVPAPSEVEVVGGSILRLAWDDRDDPASDAIAPDAVVFPARALRLGCRCAACVNEVTGEVMLIAAHVPADISITGAELVGNYGISPVFSDGHATGIYSWTYLTELAAQLAGRSAADPAAEHREPHG